jgi:hypothetical protein
VVPAATGPTAAIGCSGTNCCFTPARVKNTSHQIPMPRSPSQKTVIAIRTPATTPWSIPLEGKSGINRDINAENPPIRIRRTEKTMIEIRAQFRKLNKPMLVTIPQMAGTK